MDVIAILAIIEKGLTLIPVMIKLGHDVAPAIKSLTDLVTGARKEAVTEEQMRATDELFDSLLAEINEDIPE